MRIAAIFAIIYTALLLVACNPIETKYADTSVDPSTARHDWNYIEYPGVPAPFDGSQALRLSLHNNGSRGMGLSFSISFSIPRSKDVTETKTPSLMEKVVIRLHSHDGKVVEGKLEISTIGTGTGMVTQYSTVWSLPWKGNVMEEAFIEIRFPEQTYWMEIPYGYTRDPQLPLLSAAGHNGTAILPIHHETGRRRPHRSVAPCAL